MPLFKQEKAQKRVIKKIIQTLPYIFFLN